MNSITALGRLGKDATSRVAGQSTVYSFTMAVEKSKKDDQGKFLIDWMKVDVWGKLGEALFQYLKKGTQVFVTGRLEIEQYTNQNGVQVTQPTITANAIKLLHSPQPQGQTAAPQQQSAPKAAPPPVAQKAPSSAELDAIFASEDEIPF